ncbi:hypothetical protein Misp02_43490 [Microtetraspora sp. NBRC 16547]|nr:hypothetical protein Misp02_43490 [Microtetraspora sp. NBRC 16547]
MELGAYVVKSNAILGRVARWEFTEGDEFPVTLTPWLVAEVVVDSVAERKEAQSVVNGIEIVAEGVGDSAQVPAQAPRTLSGQHHPGFPALPQNLIDVMRAPHRQQVDHAPTGHEDHILGAQMSPDIGHIRPDEQLQMRQISIPKRRGALIPASDVLPGVTDCRGDETHPGSPHIGKLHGLP